MKKFFTLIALALAAVSANAQIAKFSATGQWNETTDVTVAPELGGAGRVGTVIVNLDEVTEPIAGFVFEVALPEGVEKVGVFEIPAEYMDTYVTYTKVEMNPVTYEDEEVTYNLYEANTLFQMKLADGSWYCPIVQNPDAKKDLVAKDPTINLDIPAGNSGKALTFKVRVPEDFEGPATITFKNVAATTINEDGNTVTNDCADFTAQLVKVSTEISTAIDRVDAQTLTGKEIYNLSGQRVSKPSQRGIYIVDGKKIMVK